jgi:hypothetical protein
MRSHVRIAASVPSEALEAGIVARHPGVRAGLQACGVKNVDVEAQQSFKLPESRRL